MKDIPELLSPEVRADPQSLYRVLRAEHPVHYDASVDAYLITRYDDVARGYKDAAFTTDNYARQLEPVHGRTILQYGGREHSKKRAIISPHLRGPGLAHWEPVIVRHAARIVTEVVSTAVDRLTDSLAERPDGDADLIADFSNQLPAYVIAEMLGLPEQDLPIFYSWYTSVIAFLSNLEGDPEVHAQGERTRQELTEYMLPMIAARRADPRDDMISALCLAEADGERMSDEEIRAYISLLLTAGAETTDKAFGSLMRYLLEDRRRFVEVRDDRSLVPMAIAETLRMCPPSQMNGRHVVEDVEIDGTTVPAGSDVFLVIASANHDESHFVHADDYDLHRPDLDGAKAFSGGAGHFGFGSGRHFCAGALLAKVELELATELFLDRFPDLEMVAGTHIVERGVKMRSPESLPVRLGLTSIDGQVGGSVNESVDGSVDGLTS